MIRTAKRFIACGASGLVFGALTAHGELDTQALREFLSQTNGTAVTFHRAFDMSPNPRALYEHLARVCASHARPHRGSALRRLRRRGAAARTHLAQCTAHRTGRGRYHARKPRRRAPHDGGQ